MPEIPADDEHRNNQEPASSSAGARRGRKLLTLSFAVPFVLIVVVLVLLYGRDRLSSTFRSASKVVSDRQLGPLFSRVPADQLLSCDNLLEAVGRSPVDPARVLAPGLEKVRDVGPDVRSSPDSGAAEETLDRDTPSTPASEVEANQDPQGQETRGTPPSSSAERPTVEVRAPGLPDAAPEGKAHEKASQPKTAPVENSGPSSTVGRFEDRDTTSRVAEKRARKQSAEEAGPTSSQAAPEPSRAEQFQLPGSLMVKIHQYTGTVPKWGLMVILDDSASMARKLRSWQPNRLHTAVEIAQKLPEALERGSKIAVRDFMCTKGSKPTAVHGPCLSHSLYEWAAHPFRGFNDKLAKAEPSGKTNPCAAAAYALKKDFTSLGDLSPRLLLITDGAHRCAFKEVLEETDKRSGRAKLSVDVLAIGMHRKRQAGYAKLAERTNGVFMRVDAASEASSAIAKYSKILKNPIKEKIEVKGEKSVVTAYPDEEVTLVPGTYTIVLPTVAGISPSKRFLEPVHIQSGQSTMVQIRVNKKGRPLAKIEPGGKAKSQ